MATNTFISPSWDIKSRHYILPESTIRDNQDKVDLEYILEYQQLDPETREYLLLLEG